MAFTTIQGSGGAPDSFLGTAGVDVIALQNQSDATFLGARQSSDTVTFTSFTNLVSNYSLYGGQGNDTLTGLAATALSNSFVAQNDGNDTITLNAVTSSTIQGNEGADVINIAGLISTSLINGNQDNDTINVNGGAAGGLIYSGSGFDSIAIGSNLSSGSIVQANQDDDTITVAAGQSVNGSTINGNQGNDTIIVNAIGGFATSTIYGGSGNDTLNAGATGALINLVFSSDDGNDNVTTGIGNDTIYNSAGNDTIATGNGANSVNATSGNNQVTVGTGRDTVTLGAGTDVVIAGGGIDSITLGGGNDTFQSTIANATVAGLNVVGGLGTNAVTITDGGATDLATGVTYSGFSTATFAANAGATAYTFNQGFWASGAATVTLTGAVIADNDTVVLNAGGTAWDAAASANAAAVTAAGDWFLDSTGVADVLTFWNQGTGSVTAMTFTALDTGAVAVAGTLTYTA